MLVRQSPSGQILGTLAPPFYTGSDFDDPNNADWPVNALAALAADSNHAAFAVRLFDDTSEEGVGFSVRVPPETREIRLTLVSRAETAPGAAVGVQPTLYARAIPDGAAIGAWNARAMAPIAIPASELWQYDTETVPLNETFLTPGDYAQFELTRSPADPDDDLVGDWALLFCLVEFI